MTENEVQVEQIEEVPKEEPKTEESKGKSLVEGELFSGDEQREFEQLNKDIWGGFGVLS